MLFMMRLAVWFWAVAEIGKEGISLCFVTGGFGNRKLLYENMKTGNFVDLEAGGAANLLRLVFLPIFDIL